jgi:hypothetical protein
MSPDELKKAKVLAEDTEAGKKLQAIGGRAAAIRQLKEKDPSKDWSNLIPKELPTKPKNPAKISLKKSEYLEFNELGQWTLVQR